MIRIHHRNQIGDGYTYYTLWTFNKLKKGDYYWVFNTNNEYKVLFKFGNYVIGLKVLFIIVAKCSQGGLR